MGVPIVGMVGGGQLARMTHQAGIALGIDFRLLAGSASDSAAQVVRDVMVGDERDASTLARFAAGCDVLTFDHEHVPTSHLHELESAGVAVRPCAEALVHAQDKAVMRDRLCALGVPCPRHRVLTDPAQVDAFGAETGWPLVLKAARGGYDGKGVWLLDGPHDPAAAEPFRAGVPVVAEERVDYVRELSALVVRSVSGQGVAYPVVESVQRDGICVEVIAPAPELPEQRALDGQRIALTIADALDVVGVLAVELFETRDGRLLVNELAMRPHNTGHWTIDGAVTSQFENHLRAVLDLPLGSPTPRDSWAVMVNVLGGDVPDLYGAYRHVMARDPGLRVHAYAKEIRPGRKVGHVTVCGANLPDLRRRARHAADYLAGAIDE